MSEEISILKSVCYELEQAGIPYMLTGSFAVNMYAVPRMTRDIDIVVEIQQEDTEKILKIFEKDFYINENSINEAIEHQGMFNIIHNELIFKVDFIVRKDTPYRQTEFQRKRQICFDDISIWIVAPEDLIISKLFWAKNSYSEMQLKDIKNLIKNIKDLDSEYISKWIKSLELEAVFKEIEAYA